MKIEEREEVSKKPTSFKNISFPIIPKAWQVRLMRGDFEEKFTLFAPKAYKNTPRGRKRK